MAELSEAKDLYGKAKEAFAEQRFEDAAKLSKDVALLALSKLSENPVETIKNALASLELDDRLLHVVSYFEKSADLLAEEASKSLRYAKEILVYVEEMLSS